MAERVINLSELIDGRPISRKQCTTVFLCGLIMFLDGYSIGTVSTTAPLLVRAHRGQGEYLWPGVLGGFAAMFTGVPIAGASAPLLGPFFLHHGGWQYTFYFGGVLPVVVAVVLVSVLPESIRFLVTSFGE